MRSERGSTLIEVLVAMLVFVSAVIAIAQLFLLAAATNVTARDTTIAATLAAQRLEQLLSADEADTIDSIEHVDASGRVLSTASTPPPHAIYTRRWSIIPLDSDTVAIRVRVGRSGRGESSGLTGETRMLAMTRRRRP
jgi:type II secretory pathway pseudopilin PulG